MLRGRAARIQVCEKRNTKQSMLSVSIQRFAILASSLVVCRALDWNAPFLSPGRSTPRTQVLFLFLSFRPNVQTRALSTCMYSSSGYPLQCSVFYSCMSRGLCMRASFVLTSRAGFNFLHFVFVTVCGSHPYDILTMASIVEDYAQRCLQTNPPRTKPDITPIPCPRKTTHRKDTVTQTLQVYTQKSSE